MDQKTIHGLSEKAASQIIEVILSHRPVEKIVIFGSRAHQSYKQTSDIDIAIFGRKWSDTDINLVKHTLEEKIKTPVTFDVINFHDIRKAKLKENILKEGVVIYEAGKD